jgi:hypothetical protein
LKVGSPYKPIEVFKRWELGTTQKLTASLLPYAKIGNWDRAFKDFVHKNFILGAIGNWESEFRLKDAQA